VQKRYRSSVPIRRQKKQYLDVTVSEHQLPPLVGKPLPFLYVLVFVLNVFVAHDGMRKDDIFGIKVDALP
jgi:hypothetical protein